MTNLSISGERYFVVFVDNKSRYTWTYVLKKKAEVFDTFQEFKALVENSSRCRIKTLRTDNGTEYLSKAFGRFLSDHRIQYQTTTPYTPQQNRVAERANRTIVEYTRTMIHAQRLEQKFWGEAVITATYLKNRSPTRSTQDNKTPFEVWNGRKLSLGYLQV